MKNILTAAGLQLAVIHLGNRYIFAESENNQAPSEANGKFLSHSPFLFYFVPGDAFFLGHPAIEDLLKK